MIGIDTQRFGQGVQARLAERVAIREAMDLRGTVLLFVGQFVARKGIVELLAALETVQAQTTAPYAVLLIGDGPDRQVIEAWLASHPNIDLRILGFKQPEELPAFYAAADLFVLPTLDDNWSLVSLEAAVAGLPQVFSIYNGVTRDLLSCGAAGQTVDPRNCGEFAAALCRYIDEPPARLAADAAAHIAETYSPEACSERAYQSIEAALRSSPQARRHQPGAAQGSNARGVADDLSGGHSAQATRRDTPGDGPPLFAHPDGGWGPLQR
jgi:glycosyltransferase involved in cell wall biosynthesis